RRPSAARAAGAPAATEGQSPSPSPRRTRSSRARAAGRAPSYLQHRHRLFEDVDAFFGLGLAHDERRVDAHARRVGHREKAALETAAEERHARLLAERRARLRIHEIDGAQEALAAHLADEGEL